MKKRYSRPELMEYGRVGRLTQGVGGTVLDVDINLVTINDDCPEQELGGGVKTILCVNVS